LHIEAGEVYSLEVLKSGYRTTCQECLSWSGAGGCTRWSIRAFLAPF